MHGTPHPTTGSANSEWWPERLNLSILRKHAPASNPMGEDFDYAEAFGSSTWPRSRATSPP
ncbi:MAG: hypothetical protein R2740_09005 [Nocardioides sp.]